jgi:DNA-binding transcriptional MerR regulator
VPEWTIGQLARRTGMRTSTLRFYEAEGLLIPARRNEAGYRLYAPQAEQILRFIQRAQRLGFSLGDIHILLQAEQDNGLKAARGRSEGGDPLEALLEVAEKRYLALERQATEILILQHELELFLQDLNSAAPTGKPMNGIVERLLESVCPSPLEKPSSDVTLDWLITHTGCSLVNLEEQTVLDSLRGRHVHIWKEGESYQILLVGHDPAVEAALRELAQLEAACHAHPAPQLTSNEEGFLFRVSGENAFIFAQLFLALEREKAKGLDIQPDFKV